MTKILIADGSPAYSRMYARAATETSDEATVGHVSAQDALLAQIAHDDYDVLVLDADFSKKTIADLFSAILRVCPNILIFFTARPSHGADALLAEAAANGAVLLMVKPALDGYEHNLAVVKRKMRELFRLLDSRRCARPSKPARAVTEPIKKEPLGQGFEIVLMAASTGGPLALTRILSDLRAPFPAPIVIVQHMLPHFTESLAVSLNRKTPLCVLVAEEGMRPEMSTVYIAPAERHLRLDTEKRIRLDDAPPVNGVRPSADVLFESVAGGSWAGVLTVILTGMGQDGSAGLSLLKQKQNCYCLTQSEKTCVVYGMPRAAVECGLADKVADLDEIAWEMRQLMKPPQEPPGFDTL